MKKLILFFLFSTVVPLASADELKIKGYIKSDPLRGGNNYLIYNKDGKTTGRIAPDPLRPSKSNYYRIYDKKAMKPARPDLTISITGGILLKQSGEINQKEGKGSDL